MLYKIKLNYFKHKYLYFKIFTAIIFIFIYSLLTFRVYRISGDDLVFPTMIINHDNVLDWLVHRYNNWSARILPEFSVYIFSQIELIYWKIVNIFFLTLGSLTMYSYARLLYKKISKKNDLFVFISSFLLYFYVNYNVLFNGAFWSTGSMNYLWVFSLGLLAMYPIARTISGKKALPKYSDLFFLLIVFIAAFSQEQVAITIIIFSFTIAIYTAYSSYKKSGKINIPAQIIGYTVAGFLGFLLSYLAPGNKIRFKLEIERWLPDYYSIGLYEHAVYSLRWLQQAILYRLDVIVSTLLVVSLVYFLSSRAKSSKSKILIGSFFIFYSVLLLSKDSIGINFIHKINHEWGSSILLIDNLINIIFLMIIPLIIFGVILLIEKRLSLIISILTLSSFLTVIILMASPTMYASGWRTLFIPSMLFAFTVLLIISKLMDSFYDKKVVQLFIATFIIYGSISCMYFMYRIYTYPLELMMST